MTRPRALLWVSAACLFAAAAAVPPARAGHELPFYPSYYPQEIKLEFLKPQAAGAQLGAHTLHAWIGSDPFPAGRVPADVRPLDSLAGYVVLTFNPASPAARVRESRCEAAARLGRVLPEKQADWALHPYPVTPFHADYLHHFDLARAARQQVADAPARPPALKVRARGGVARRLARGLPQGDERQWDAVIEEVEPPTMAAPPGFSLNGWLGPPWIKEGWFAAWLLQSGAPADPAARQAAEALYRRLVGGHYEGPAERLELERRLVARLISGCERVVLGYTLRREYFSAEFSQGIENVAHDSHTGLNSAIFLRTAKLKDFPWNGWMRLGMEGPAAAAWNPIGGFTDPAGRLLWWALGDPALLPAPRASGWIGNRAAAASVSAGPPMEIPADALLPEPGTGLLKEVGAGKTARSRVIYRISTSLFHDGTRMTAADAVYAYSVAARWGARGRDHDPVLEAATAGLRESLAGFKILGVETEVRKYSDVTLTYVTPVIAVWLTHASGDSEQLAAAAPPWSALPWHVLALMEETVRRGHAAFSREEARRRGVPWLDLARAPRLREQMAAVLADLAGRNYIPPPLRGLVQADEAQHRWLALRNFAQRRGHFLVTNGPYQLDKWSDTEVALQVFRDFTYPLGVGSYDRYAVPLRAYVSRAVARGTRLEIHAEVEEAQKFLRDYRIAREPLTGRPLPADRRDIPVCRYVVIAADGHVAAVGASQEPTGGVYRLDLGRQLGPGSYTVLVALAVRDNYVNPEVAVVNYRVEPAP
jgi:hypothetical protein